MKKTHYLYEERNIETDEVIRHVLNYHDNHHIYVNSHYGSSLEELAKECARNSNICGDDYIASDGKVEVNLSTRALVCGVSAQKLVDFTKAYFRERDKAIKEALAGEGFAYR